MICQYNNALAREPKKQPGVRRPIWEDNFKKACYRNHICRTDRTYVAQDTVLWRAVVSKVMKDRLIIIQPTNALIVCHLFLNNFF